VLRFSTCVPLCAVGLSLFLGACVTTPRLYSPLELADVAIACNVPPTALVQEPDLRKVLFLYTVAPSDQQLDCVHQWARKHRFHLGYIEAVNQQTD
jgi:hypothetical protein